MAKSNIYASSEFLNDFEWHLWRLMMQIELLEGIAISTRDLHFRLSLLLKEAQNKRWS